MSIGIMIILPVLTLLSMLGLILLIETVNGLGDDY